MTGMIWGLTGDCYFKLKESENGFAAYRRAIEMDPKAGCLALFARQVAAYRRVEDAAFAIECLDMYRSANREALLKYPIHHIIHSLPPDMLYLRFAVLPCVRLRLRRLAKQAKL
jgi:tetratricopeptide (TPR) repeat protein